MTPRQAIDRQRRGRQPDDLAGNAAHYGRILAEWPKIVRRQIIEESRRNDRSAIHVPRGAGAARGD